MTSELPRTVDVAGISLHPLRFEQAVDWIVDRANRGDGGTVCTPNADYVVRQRHDAAFRQAILQADVRVPDGMGVIYAARIARRPLRSTVTGRLLLPAVARIAAEREWTIALYGAGPGVAAAAAAVLSRRYPGLRIAAAITPPGDLRIGSEVDNRAVRELHESRARVLFVGLGAPKQELWMEAHRDELPGMVIVGVGAALDIVSGKFRTAPNWMTRVGLEWAFRLAQEPRRLAKRYLVDDPWIIYWAFRERWVHRSD